ncbi:MAG: response regulator, partial [Undibacterium sp.]
MSIRVMIVDDDATQHAILEGAIRRLLPEAVVIHALGVVPALAHLRESAGTKKSLPDLIITDLNMPALSGWQFCAILKADEKLCAIPVIMATTEASFDPTSDFQLLVKERVIAGVVRKPVSLEAMKTALRAVFPILFPPPQFLVIHDEPRLLSGALKDIRGWLQYLLKYPPPLTTNQAHGAITLLGAGLGVDAVIVGMEDPEALHAFLRKVREREEWRDLPIIVIADPADVEGQRRSVEVGATGFIATPLNANVRATNAELVKTFIDHPPLGRAGTAEDIVGPAIFLASDLS